MKTILKMMGAIVATVTLSLAFLGCRKPCNSKIIERIPVEEKMKGYFGFSKEGSYWVYHNQDHSKTDSLYVVSYSHIWLKDNINCREEEMIDISLKSRDKNLVLLDAVCIREERSHLDFQACPNSLFFDNIGYLQWSGDIFISNDQQGISMDSVKLNGIEYSGELQDIFTRNSPKNHLYLKKYVGIVGWSTPSDTFNLINYSLLQ